MKYLLIIFIVYLVICFIMFLFISYRGMDKLFGVINKKIEQTLSPYKDKYLKEIEWINKQDIKKVSIKSYDNLDLNASFLKNKKEKYILILSHGYRSTPDRDIYASLREYYNMGCSILFVDLRACASSSGNFITFGYKESKDLNSWIDYVHKKNPKAKIILGGISLGATSSLLVNNKYVKAMILDCGFKNAYNQIKYTINHYFHLPSLLFVPTIDLYFRLFNGISLKKIDTFNNLDKLNIPILFIHGKSDEFIPYHNTVDNYDYYEHEKELLLVDNADHGMSYLIDRDKYINKINDFIKKYL